MEFEYPFFSGCLKVIYSEEGVTEIRFQKKKFSGQKKWGYPMVGKIAGELDHYLKGHSQFLDFSLDWQNLGGTVFQKQVWKKIKQIPYSQVRTYGEIARSMKKPGASRAVGTACAKNPLLLAIPCHRVVGTGGLGGFSGGGLNIKRKLHLLEGIHL